MKRRVICFFSQGTSLTTMLKMTDVSTLMPILELLGLQRSLIEKKLHGTTSQWLPQKMVNYFLSHKKTCHLYIKIYAKFFLRSGTLTLFICGAGIQHLTECTKHIRCSYSLSDTMNKSHFFFFYFNPSIPVESWHHRTLQPHP